ncbi:TonB-dependent receptor [Cetobacterium somerae]|uniref:TonB-dependent receptor n=1 Tax=Cetobacterium somerae TaxID=188913 RepID=UPI003D76879F
MWRGRYLVLFFLQGICIFSMEKTIKLEETVVVSKSGFDTPLVSENKNVIVLFKDEIDNGNHKNVEDVLRDAPNVIVQETYFGPRVDIRGNGEKSISKVKILSDGIALNSIDESMGTLPINTIPLNSIERIDITPGGNSVIYGSGSSGGVINIITKSSLKKDFLILETGIKSYDFRSGGISFGQNLNENLYGNFNYTYLNGNGYRDGDSQESNNFSGGLDYKIDEKNRVKVTMGYFKGDKDYSTGISKELLKENRKAAGFPIDSDSKRKTYSLDYEYKFSENLTFLTTLYYQSFKRDFKEISLMDYVVPKVGNMPFEIIGKDLDSSMYGSFKENSKGINLRGKYQYLNGELILGYDYNHTKLKRDSEIKASGEFFPVTMPYFKIKGEAEVNLKNDIFKESNGIYALNTYNLTDKLELVLGARYEHSSLGGKRTSETEVVTMGKNTYYREIDSDEKTDNYALEVGTDYKYSSSGTFYTRYERGFTSPLPGQITDKVGNHYEKNNLKSEISHNFEVGMRDYYEEIFMNLSVFSNFTSNEIVLIQKNSYNPAIKEWQYKNLNEVRKFGGELYLEEYFENLTLYQSFSYVNTKITKGIYEGEELPLVPSGKIVLGGSYNINEKLKFNANFNWVGSYMVKEYERDNTPIDSKVKSYNYTDLMLTYEVNEYFDLSFGINNLFNEKYNYEETRDIALPAPGRNYFITGKMSI